MGGRDGTPGPAVAAGAIAAALLGLLAGTALQLRQAALVSGEADAALAVAGLLGLLAAGRVRGRAAWPVLALAVGALAFAATDWRATERLAQRLAPTLEGRDLVVTGVVASLPQAGPSGVRFVFEVEQAATRAGEPVALPPRLALGWYRHGQEDGSLVQPQTVLRAGQRWQLPLRLRLPHGTSNPHGFDLELNLFERGIGATGYVRDAPAVLLDAAAGAPLERWRQSLRDALQAAVPDPRAAGVLAALALGDQAAIEREDWELFRLTGVGHLMSISGLHVTMLAWLAALAIARLWRLAPRAMLALPAPLAGRWGGLCVAIAYAAFAGWGVPAQRTVWMLAAVVGLSSLGLHWPAALVLLAAAALVVAIDPWALLQVGFWLSFAAVALLMASEPARRAERSDAGAGAAGDGWRGRADALAALVRGGLRTQLVATLGLAPLTLLFFNQWSLVGFAANLVAIPWVTLVITPLALLGALAAPAWGLAAALLQPLSAWLQALAQWPAAVWSVPAAPGWAQACGLLAGALLVLPLPWRLRALALPLALPFLLPPPQWPPTGHFELVAVDVGQGTAVLVRTRQSLLVYDAGPQHARDSDAGRRVLLPLLRGRGETRIDTLVLSHRDSDHVGGAASLLSAWPAGELRSSLEPGHPLLARGLPHRRCAAGDAWVRDGVRFELLHPAAGDDAAARRPNEVSCVLRIVAADGRAALLTGDIEAPQERALLARDAGALRAEVLVAPHHGSRTSSTPEFLQAVSPTVSVFQAGYRSRFGHPADDVVARHRALGSRPVASPSCGAWTWRSDQPVDARTEIGTCHRGMVHRYWMHGASRDPK